MKQLKEMLPFPETVHGLDTDDQEDVDPAILEAMRNLLQ